MRGIRKMSYWRAMCLAVRKGIGITQLDYLMARMVLQRHFSSWIYLPRRMVGFWTSRMNVLWKRYSVKWRGWRWGVFKLRVTRWRSGCTELLDIELSMVKRPVIVGRRIMRRNDVYAATRRFEVAWKMINEIGNITRWCEVDLNTLTGNYTDQLDFAYICWRSRFDDGLSVSDVSKIKSSYIRPGWSIHWFSLCKKVTFFTEDK